MAEAGVKPLEIVYVHALAAAEALAHGDVDTELHDASRIAELTDALLREHDAHRESGEHFASSTAAPGGRRTRAIATTRLGQPSRPGGA